MSNATDALRIGCASAGGPDLPELALQMVERGNVSYACFDTLAERTLAMAQQRKAADPTTGYDPLLRPRVGRALAPAKQRGTRLLGNMGCANPVAAGQVLLEEAEAAGLDELALGVVTGDDVLEAVSGGALEVKLWDERIQLADLVGPRLVSANAYLGFRPAYDALSQGAEVIVTGRATDVAPYMASLFHHFDWPLDDLPKLAAAVTIGHLLECGRWATGAAHEDPAWGWITPDSDNMAFPLAEVSDDGTAVITKVDGTGGEVTRISCAQQLLHETGDNTRYMTPDVTLDMSQVSLEEVGKDRVRVRGARGNPAPSTYKVLLGMAEGWIGELEASFAGRGAAQKAHDATEWMLRRLDRAGVKPSEVRKDVIGMNSVFGPAMPAGEEPRDVRMRLACRLSSEQEAEAFAVECQDVWFAPQVGVGGVRTYTRPVLAMYPASVLRDSVPIDVSVTNWKRAETDLGAKETEVVHGSR